MEIVSFEDVKSSINKLITQNESLQKDNLELRSKLLLITDEILESKQQVRIGPGFWNMNSTIVVATFVSYLFCIIIIGLEYSGVNINFNSSVIWPIPVVVTLWGIVQNTSNKQYKSYQEQCDEMLITRLKNAIKEGVAEAKAEWQAADAREEQARLKLEAESKAEWKAADAREEKARQKLEDDSKAANAREEKARLQLEAETKADREKSEATAKADREKSEATTKADREKSEATAKADREKSEATAKADREKSEATYNRLTSLIEEVRLSLKKD